MSAIAARCGGGMAELARNFRFKGTAAVVSLFLLMAISGAKRRLSEAQVPRCLYRLAAAMWFCPLCHESELPHPPLSRRSAW